jgi:hypothetical protein
LHCTFNRAKPVGSLLKLLLAHHDQIDRQQETPQGSLEPNHLLVAIRDMSLDHEQIDVTAVGGIAAGHLHASCGAGSRNEFNEEVAGLAPTLGIRLEQKPELQAGEYWIRGGLNAIPWLDEVALPEGLPGAAAPVRFGMLGLKLAITPHGGKVVGMFKDGSPAVVTAKAGKGKTICFAGCPGLSSLKDAGFVATELKEQYPAAQRSAINAWAKAVRGVRSVERGPLQFAAERAPSALRAAGFEQVVRFSLPLGLNDIILAEYSEP